MESVKFDVDDEPARRRFLDEVAPRRLASLAADAKPAWGRMSAQQMVEHLAWLWDLSTGHAEVACPIPEAKRERFKPFLRNAMESPRDLMNPALAGGLPPLKSKNMADAVAACEASRRRFADPTEPVRSGKFVHPLLGPLDHDEWSRFHFKHVFHHLLQFGAITAAAGRGSVA